MDYKILIADDDTSIHEAIESALHEDSYKGSNEIVSLKEDLFDFSVETPHSDSINYIFEHVFQAEEAIAKVDSASGVGVPFSLIIMDSRMPPGIDGPSAIERIFDKYRNVDIILLTAYSDLDWEDIQSRIKYKDQFIYLKKPFDINVLRQIVSMFASTSIKVESIKKQLNRYEEDLNKRTRELNSTVEDYLIAEKESRQAQNIKHEFISTISHELRTPLTAAISIMKAFERTGLSEEQISYLKIVNETHDILLHILDNILDFSRLENNNLELYEKVFNYKKLVNMNVIHMTQTASENENVINVRIDERIPDYLIGDPSKIRQIYANLLGNAIKFTQKGKIDVILELLNEDENTATILTSIVDTGIGIDSSQYEKIFSYFSQADSSIHRQFGGTGIGLNVSKQLVEKMNGKIGIVSKLKEGTNFSFHIVLKKIRN